MDGKVFCLSCGSENEQGARFCTACGAAFPELPAEPEPEPVAVPEPASSTPELEPEPEPEPVAAFVPEAEPVAAPVVTEEDLTVLEEAAPEEVAAEIAPSEEDSSLDLDATVIMTPAATPDPQATAVMDPQATVAMDPQATVAMEAAVAPTADVTSMMAPVEPAAPKHYDAAATVKGAHGKQSAKPKRKRGLVIGIVVAVVAVALAVGGVFLYMHKQAQERQDLLEQLANKTYPVNIVIEAEGYSPQTSSPIPLRVDGTTYDGETVQQKYLIGPDSDDSIELERGNYTVMVPVSPVTQQGGLFLTGQATASFTISDPEVEDFLASSAESDPDREQIQALLDAQTEPVEVPKLVLIPLPMTSVTDSLITDTYEGLIEYGLPQSEAAGFQNAMVEGHQQAEREQREQRATDRETYEAQIRDLQSVENSIANSSSNPDSPGFLSMMDKSDKMAELRTLTRQLVDELYAYVLDVIPESERATLQTSQSEWDAAATQAAEDYFAPLRKESTPGQTLNFSKIYVDANLSRARELANMIE